MKITEITKKLDEIRKDIRKKVYDLMKDGGTEIIDFEHISDFFVTDNEKHTIDVHTIVIEESTVYLVGMFMFSFDLEEVVDINQLEEIMNMVNDEIKK